MTLQPVYLEGAFATIISSSLKPSRAPDLLSCARDFGPFDGRTWLNTAHQGALPRVAAEAARSAVLQKVRPALIQDDDFFGVPVRLRTALGRLTGANPDDIILGNSATFGLDILVNGIRWTQGDEILLVEGDFPANVFPWLTLQDQGVIVRYIRAAPTGLDPQQLAPEISSRTRLLCVSWVDSFTGSTLDLNGLGRVCKTNGVNFVVNGSQGLGARPLDLGSLPIDAFTCCGCKWLCGPYGTGFCWLRPAVRESLAIRHAYWLTMVSGASLDSTRGYSLRTDLGARAWDVFSPANSFNFVPWTASLEYLLDVGADKISTHDDALVDQILRSLNEDIFQLVSPRERPRRSALVILRLRKPSELKAWSDRLLTCGIDIAFGDDSMRISPHVHNTSEEIANLMKVLAGS